MVGKKAVRKVLKWGFPLIGGVAFLLLPLILIFVLSGVIMALFGNSSTSSVSTSTYLSGALVSDTAVYLHDYFVDAGYTEIQTAAILGNLQWESRLDLNSSSDKGGTSVRGIAQWTSYGGSANKLEQYAIEMGMDWTDPELQCLCISTTLQGTNSYCGWYDTGMAAFYGVTKNDFWQGDLYAATMSFFCCFEDPEEYPGGCNSKGYSSGASCLTISFDCGNGHGRYPYAQAYYDYFTGDGDSEGTENGAVQEKPQGGMGIPLYLQSSYASVPWGNTNLANSGCGPTCLAMVMTYLTGRTVTPSDMIGWCGTAYLAPTGSSWSFFPAAAQHYGVSYRSVTDEASVRAALEAGHPVIAREMAGSFFSERGHFIVLRGVTASGGYLVNDPAAKYSVNREFTWSEIHRSENFYMIFGE